MLSHRPHHTETLISIGSTEVDKSSERGPISMQMKEVSDAVAKLVAEQAPAKNTDQPKPESKQKGRRERKGGGRVQGSGAFGRLNRK